MDILYYLILSTGPTLPTHTHYMFQNIFFLLLYIQGDTQGEVALDHIVPALREMNKTKSQHKNPMNKKKKQKKIQQIGHSITETTSFYILSIFLFSISNPPLTSFIFTALILGLSYFHTIDPLLYIKIGSSPSSSPAHPSNKPLVLTHTRSDHILNFPLNSSNPKYLN